MTEGRRPAAGNDTAAVSPLERQLQWYIGIRLVAVACMALPYYLANLGPEIRGEATATTQANSAGGFFALIFGLTCLATLAYIALLKPLRNRPQVLAYLQFFGDILLITGLVYYFGGLSSPFYLLVIMLASTLLNERAGILVASASYILYAGLLLALAFGWIQSPTGPTETGLDARLVYSLLAHLFGFFAVARLTSYLASNVARVSLELEEKRGDLATLQVVHRDVIESIPSGLSTTALDGTVTSINRAGRAILDKQDEDLVGTHIVDTGLFTADEWEEFSGGTQSSARLRSEVKLQRGESHTFVGFSLSRLTDSVGEQRGFIVIFQDLTRWRKLEDAMRMKDRMAAVGELAAGIAHEIGNPLAAISGSVQMLTRSEGRDPAESKLLEILLKESQRLDRTIKGLLRFARPKDRSSIRFELASLLAESIELLRNSAEISRHHEIELTLDSSEVMMIGDPDQISQIFWNLARNAIKAMPEGGTLAVEGRLVGDVYSMAFRDTGRGMTEEERDNLFHPFQSFFDTGTGIGMAIVYRIVQEHGGQIAVESTLGQGTTITVELPSAEALLKVAP